MPRKQKWRRPTAAVEVVVEADRYAAVKFSDPTYSDSGLIQVYSKPHHDPLFKAWCSRLGFDCKRCKTMHYLSWDNYCREIAREGMTPPYHVLCTEVVGVELVRADEQIPNYLKGFTLGEMERDPEAFVEAPPAYRKAYRIFTIEADMISLLENIAAALLTSKDAVRG